MFIVKGPLLAHLERIILRQDDRTEYRRWTRNCIGLMALTYLALLLNYYTVLEHPNPPEWAERIAKKCSNYSSITLLSTSYQARSMLDSGQSALGFGAYLGLLFKTSHFSTNVQYYSGAEDQQTTQ